MKVLGEVAVIDGVDRDFIIAPDFLELVVAHRAVERAVEPLAMRSGFRQLTDVPFPRDACGITFGAENFCHGERIRAQTIFVAHEVARNTLSPAASNRIGAGEQSHAGWRADRCTGMEIRETYPIFGELIEYRGFDRWVAIAAKVLIAKVIGHDQDHIGFACAFSQCELERSQRQRESE